MTSLAYLRDQLVRQEAERHHAAKVRAAHVLMRTYGYDYDEKRQVYHYSDPSRISVDLATVLGDPALALLFAAGPVLAPPLHGPN